MVLIASMVVPANAATTVLQPKDNIYRAEYLDNNIEKIYYYFNVGGYISIKARNGGQSYTGYGNVSFGKSGTIVAPEVFLIRAFPLGSSFAPGGSMPDTVIDVSDFKSRATISLNCQFYIDAQYRYQAEAYGETSFYFLSDPFVCFYDKNGSFIDQVTVNDFRTDITLENASDDTVNTGASYLVNLPIPLTIPEGAAYLAPCIISYLYPPDTEDAHVLSSVGISSQRFGLSADKNLLIEQSETLEAVEEQLEDLNDKTDIIINGTPEIDGKIDIMEEDVTNQKDDMHIVEDAEKEYLDQWEESNNEFKNKILTFLQGAGWVQLADLLSPFMNWSSLTTIMVMVVAFVNLSVILFGR